MSTNWPQKKLGSPEVATIILGQSPPSSSYNQNGSGLPFFQGKADFGLIHPTPRYWCNAGQQFATKNDILISVRAPVGDVNVAEGDCIIGRGVSAIRAKNDVEPWFLFFAMQHLKPVLESQATGTTFASVNKATLVDLDIPIPPQKYQVLISQYLRLVLTSLTHQQAILSEAQELKRATMRELFTRGLRGEKQKETEIGLVPESWDILPAEKIFKLTSGKTRPSTLTEQATSEYPYPVLGGNGVMGYSSEWNWESAKTVVIGRVGEYCGAVHIASGKLWITDNALYVKEWINASIEIPYIAAFLKYYDLNRFKRMAGQPLVTQGMINEHSFPIPAPDEQREISEILDAIDQKIDLHKRKKAVLEDLFKSLLHKLMTGEIRVADLDLSALDIQEKERATA